MKTVFAKHKDTEDAKEYLFKVPSHKYNERTKFGNRNIRYTRL
jgi:hypothetical protein